MHHGTGPKGSRRSSGGPSAVHACPSGGGGRRSSPERLRRRRASCPVPLRGPSGLRARRGRRRPAEGTRGRWRPARRGRRPRPGCRADRPWSAAGRSVRRWSRARPQAPGERGRSSASRGGECGPDLLGREGHARFEETEERHGRTPVSGLRLPQSERVVVDERGRLGTDLLWNMHVHERLTPVRRHVREAKRCIARSGAVPDSRCGPADQARSCRSAGLPVSLRASFADQTCGKSYMGGPGYGPVRASGDAPVGASRSRNLPTGLSVLWCTGPDWGTSDHPCGPTVSAAVTISTERGDALARRPRSRGPRGPVPAVGLTGARTGSGRLRRPAAALRITRFAHRMRRCRKRTWPDATAARVRF